MLKEYLDMATILSSAKTNEEIANKMTELGVLCPPCKVGDEVFFLVARGAFGSLVTTGIYIKRKVDEISWNGKNFVIRSYRDNPNDPCGNLSSEWNDLVFESEESAEKRLSEIKDCMK